MRLKESPKKALTVIDYLIQVGHCIIFDYYGLWYKSEANKRIGKGKEFNNWFDLAENYLKRVFLDFAPIHKILKCKIINENYSHIGTRITDDEKKPIMKALDVLTEYYDYLVALQKSPVRFITDKAEIWLYDLCCPIEPESNESALCNYMFDFGIGEWVEIALIHKAIVGQEYDSRAKDKNVVVNALDGLNRKTKEAFDFPLLKKRKTVVALAIPSHFILEQK